MEGNGSTPGQVQLVITFDQITGRVEVNGPVQNLILCYGMLEAAKDSIRSWVARQAGEQRIIPAARIVS